MSDLDAVHEFRLVSALIAGMPRSPDQRNAPHGADAELLRLPDGNHLALNVDGMQEEIAVGLLRDPYAIGWAVVAHGLSDLAAVAARPLGVLLSSTLPTGADEAWRERLQAGVREALEAHGTYCLGGDTSVADAPSFHCCAVGWVEGDAYWTREGGRPGDGLWTTGPAGTGNLVGISRRVSEETWKQAEALYRPRARFAAAAAARPFVRAAIDTSDGLLSALYVLSSRSGCGARFEHGPEVYHPMLRELSQRAPFPLWFGGAFGMGDYELLLAVPPEAEEDLEAAVREAGAPPRRIGELTEEPGLVMVMEEGERPLDGARLLNLFAESGSLDAYVDALLEVDAELRGAGDG